MAFCSSHLQPHWWLEGLLPWAVIWIIWFWAFSLTSYFRSYLMLLDLGDSWVCASATHTQNCARPCSLLCGCGQGFQLHLLRPAVCSICFIAALPQHIPYLRYLQCPAVSSSVQQSSSDTNLMSHLPTSHAVPCRFLVKTWWDRIACSPISPSLALGSVVQHHSNVCESSSKVLYIILIHFISHLQKLGCKGKHRPRPLPLAPCFHKPSTWVSLQIPSGLAHCQLRIFLSLWAMAVNRNTGSLLLLVAYNL